MSNLSSFNPYINPYIPYAYFYTPYRPSLHVKVERSSISMPSNMSSTFSSESSLYKKYKKEKIVQLEIHKRKLYWKDEKTHMRCLKKNRNVYRNELLELSNLHILISQGYRITKKQRKLQTRLLNLNEEWDNMDVNVRNIQYKMLQKDIEKITERKPRNENKNNKNNDNNNDNNEHTDDDDENIPLALCYKNYKKLTK